MAQLDDLLEAVYRGDVQLIAKMRDAGLELDIRDEDGRTALMHAALADKPNRALFEFLLAQGADPNAREPRQQWTALHFAARDQKHEIVEMLLDAGAEVDARDVFGNSPLWRATSIKNWDRGVIDVLMRFGADPDLMNRHNVSPRQLAETSGDSELKAIFGQKTPR